MSILGENLAMSHYQKLQGEATKKPIDKNVNLLKSVDQPKIQRARSMLVDKFKPYQFAEMFAISLFGCFRCCKQKVKKPMNKSMSYASIQSASSFERFKNDERRLMKETDIVSLLNTIKELKDSTKLLKDQIEQSLQNQYQYIDLEPEPEYNKINESNPKPVNISKNGNSKYDEK